MEQPHQEPLGVGWLISAVRAAGHSADAVFFTDPRRAVRHAVTARPDVLAFSAMTGAHRTYLALNREIKKHINSFSIFGGPHPTYSPDMAREPGVDAVCRGEAETALPLLLDRFAQGGGAHLTTPNFWFNHRGEIIKNDPAPLIEKLDSLPFPDRAAFYQNPTHRHAHLKSFMASRGCPYTCTYCFNHQYNALYRGLGPVVRRRSVDNVVAEVLEVKAAYPLGMVQFMDDIFISSAAWVEEFSEKFPARAGVPFFCNVRAELVTPEIVRDLKRAGCWSVCVGVETGDEDLRRRMLGRRQTNEQIRDAIRLFRANRIRVMTTNMAGIPGGSFESDWKTYRLNAECRVDYPWVSITYPYPGTRIHELAREQGLQVPSGNELSHSYFNEMPFDAPDKARIENLHRLMALMVRFPRLEPLFKILIDIKGAAPRALYTLAFGFWKLYCYETRIFKKPGARWLFGSGALPRFITNAALGLRMMFPQKQNPQPGQPETTSQAKS